MKIKPAAKIAGFIIGLMILLKIMSFLFGGGFWFAKGYIYDRNARNAALSLETKGQIDVLNIGDSLSTTALTPLELFRDYGYTAYNCGQDRQTPIELPLSRRSSCSGTTAIPLTTAARTDKRLLRVISRSELQGGPSRSRSFSLRSTTCLKRSTMKVFPRPM